MRKIGIVLTLLLLLLNSSSPVGATTSYRPRDGREVTASYYTGSYGSCGKLEGNYAASMWYPCGAKVRLERGNKFVVVTIMDRCQCAMDVSKRAFSRLAPLTQGLVRVSMYFVG